MGTWGHAKALASTWICALALVQSPLVARSTRSLSDFSSSPTSFELLAALGFPILTKKPPVFFWSLLLGLPADLLSGERAPLSRDGSPSSMGEVGTGGEESIDKLGERRLVTSPNLSRLRQ